MQLIHVFRLLLKVGSIEAPSRGELPTAIRQRQHKDQGSSCSPTTVREVLAHLAAMHMIMIEEKAEEGKTCAIIRPRTDLPDFDELKDMRSEARARCIHLMLLLATNPKLEQTSYVLSSYRIIEEIRAILPRVDALQGGLGRLLSTLRNSKLLERRF